MHRSKFKDFKAEWLKKQEEWDKRFKSMTLFEAYFPLVFLVLLYLAWHIPVSRINQIQEKQDALYELVKAKVAAAEEHPTARKAFSLDNLVKYTKPDGGMSNVSKPRAVSDQQSGYYTGGSIVMRGPRPRGLRPAHVQLPDLSWRGEVKK